MENGLENKLLNTYINSSPNYVYLFRDSFWPEGVLAEPRPARSHNTKMRTRVVCRSKMLGSIPGELAISGFGLNFT